MKHANPNQTGQSIPCLDIPQDQGEYGEKPAADVAMVIEEIHQRAEYVGSVLEEILQAGHERLNSGKSG